MTAGFPTDDPWGDRQQGTPLPEFCRVPVRRASASRGRPAPGSSTPTSATRSSAGSSPRSPARPTRTSSGPGCSAPLGMARTGFEAADVAPGELAAAPARPRPRWAEISPAPCGAFAPMGGVFSCVRDLAVWVAGFAAAFPPGPEETGGPHPLSRASPARDAASAGRHRAARARCRCRAASATGSYGFGLFVEDDPAWGRIVQHSGGYPGFGSNMRWHPATGLGVIVLGNSTYAPVGPFAVRLLTTVLRQQARRAAPSRAAHLDGSAHADRALALAPAGPWPETVAARDECRRADAVLERRGGGEAVFRQRRASTSRSPSGERKIAADPRAPGRISATIGRGRRSSIRPRTAAGGWPGTAGAAQVEIRLNPERPAPGAVADPRRAARRGSPLRLMLDQIIALMNDGAMSWPALRPAAPALDRALLMRRLRAAAAWAGPVPRRRVPRRGRRDVGHRRTGRPVHPAAAHRGGRPGRGTAPAGRRHARIVTSPEGRASACAVPNRYPLTKRNGKVAENLRRARNVFRYVLFRIDSAGSRREDARRRRAGGHELPRALLAGTTAPRVIFPLAAGR